jgi:hypothetical protein
MLLSAGAICLSPAASQAAATLFSEVSVRPADFNLPLIDRTTTPAPPASPGDRVSDRFSEPYVARGNPSSGGGRVSGTVGAQALPGFLGLQAQVTSESFFTGQVFGSGRAEAQARFLIADMLISGPPGATTVVGDLSLAFKPLVNADAVYTGGRPGRGDGLAEGRFDIQISASMPGGAANGSILGSRTSYSHGDIADRLEDRGLLAGFAPDAVAGTPFDIKLHSQSLPVGRPFSVQVLVSLSASNIQSLTLGGGGSSDGLAAFQIGFPFSGPVFDLPPGFTVNSSDGFITDNQFLLAPPTPAVPLPGALPLLILPLAGLGLLARRKDV